MRRCKGIRTWYMYITVTCSNNIIKVTWSWGFKSLPKAYIWPASTCIHMSHRLKRPFDVPSHSFIQLDAHPNATRELRLPTETHLR